MSQRYALDKTDFKKIGIGCMVAFLGLALFYLILWIAGLNQSSVYNPFFAALLMILVNVARKFLQKSEELLTNDTTEQEPIVSEVTQQETIIPATSPVEQPQVVPTETAITQ